MRNEKNHISLQPEKIILGIDPGTNIMGYGLVAQESKKIKLIDTGVIKLSKLENQALKLKNIFQSSLDLIEKYHPDELAIESQFFGKNI
ncbi:MAG: crossover junction endodeoxyribonuclease RuvC, partial [Bacteroidales bacterium]|nr:crossover junction endodeoxyribonuclease RuvC [Bacteroidales bacterium]